MEKSEAKFPLNFTACPNCGSTRRIAGEVLEVQKSLGKMGPKTNAFLYQHQSLIVDPTKAWFSAPLITSFYDACVDCGAVYCIHAELKNAVPGMGNKQAGHGFSTS